MTTPLSAAPAALSLALAVGLAGGGAEAQTRPAPDYFVEAVIALQAAEQVAKACPDLSLNAPVIQQATMDVMQRLQADGFDVTRADAGMSASKEAFAAAQADFVGRHGLAGSPPAEKVCAAGRSEMSADSLIGRYLIAGR